MSGSLARLDMDHGAPAGFRTLPHNIEAEQAVLGAILVNNLALGKCGMFLDPEDFFEPVHGRIYSAMIRVIGRGQVADPVTLRAEFEADPDLREVNGARYLAEIARAAIPILDVYSYGEVVKDLAVRRRLIAELEQRTSALYDPRSERVRQHLVAVQQAVGALQAAGSAACNLPALDLEYLAENEPAPERWLIDRWLPIGTSGIFAGEGSVGKSYLELIKLVCLAAGRPFLGFELEATPALAYFDEDNMERLGRRLRHICDGLGVDMRSLQGRLEIVSTVGQRRVLFSSEARASTVTPEPWLAEIHDRAIRMRARYLSFDHLNRYCLIESHVNNLQVFDLFKHLDALATSLDGCITILSHPSATSMKQIAQRGGGAATVYEMVGGAGALVNAPRYVHTLSWRQDEPEEGSRAEPERYRVLGSHKANYESKFGCKLVQHPDTGLVENRGEVEVDKAPKKGRGRPSQAAQTIDILRELYTGARAPVALDDLVEACIARGVIGEVDTDDTSSSQWRARRKTIRSHLDRRIVDIRDGDRLAIKPGQ